MKNIYFLLISVVLAACNKPVPTGEFDKVFNGLSGVKNFKEAEKYYSGGTVKAVNRVWKIGLVKRNNRLSLLPLFNKFTRLELKNKKINNRKAVVQIKYIEHPVENMIGSEAVIRFVLEKGDWKIDLEKEINEIAGRIKIEVNKDYFKRKLPED